MHCRVTENRDVGCGQCGELVERTLPCGIVVVLLKANKLRLYCMGFFFFTAFRLFSFPVSEREYRG